MLELYLTLSVSSQSLPRLSSTPFPGGYTSQLSLITEELQRKEGKKILDDTEEI